MAIFTGSREYRAYAQHLKLTEGRINLDSISAGILGAILSGGSIPDNLIGAVLTGLPGKVKKYFEYGRDKYYWGLPFSQFEYRELTDTLLKEVIDKYVAPAHSNGPMDSRIIRVWYPVTRTQWEWYRRFHPMADEFGNVVPTLYDDWYNVNDFTCYPPEGNPSGDEWFCGGVPEDGYGFQLPDPFAGIRNIINLPIRSNWRLRNPFATQPKEIVHQGPVLQPEWEADDREFIIIWFDDQNDNRAEPADWPLSWKWPPTYVAQALFPDPRYPELQYKIDPGSANFLPIGVFYRTYEAWTDGNKLWEETLLGLMKTLEIDAYSVWGAFVEEAIKQGENLAGDRTQLKFWDFFIGFMLDVRGAYRSPSLPSVTDPVQLAKEEYFRRFMEQIAQQSNVDLEVWNRYMDAFDAWEAGGFDPDDSPPPKPPRQTMRVVEGTAAGYNYELNWSYLDYTISTNPDIYPSIPDRTPPFIIGATPYTTYHYYNFKVERKNRPPLYMRFRLLNFEHRYLVDIGGLYLEPAIVLSEDGNFRDQPFIPLNWDIVQDMSYRNRELLLYDSLTAVVFVVSQTYIPWYANELFQALVIVVAIVLVVTTLFIGIKGVAAVIAQLGVPLTAASFIIKAVISASVTLAVDILSDGDPILTAITAVVTTLLLASPEGIQGLGPNLKGGLTNLFDDVLKFIRTPTFSDGVAALVDTQTVVDTSWKLIKKFDNADDEFKDQFKNIQQLYEEKKESDETVDFSMTVLRAIRGDWAYESPAQKTERTLLLPLPGGEDISEFIRRTSSSSVDDMSDPLGDAYPLTLNKRWR